MIAILYLIAEMTVLFSRVKTAPLHIPARSCLYNEFQLYKSKKFVKHPKTHMSMGRKTLITYKVYSSFLICQCG